MQGTFGLSVEGAERVADIRKEDVEARGKRDAITNNNNNKKKKKKKKSTLN
jgi:hypothetical protein